MQNENNQTRVAIVSHEASLTGAPIVLLGLADSLVELGYNPTFFCRSAGPLEAVLRKKNIKTVIGGPLSISKEINCGHFEAAFINTIVNYDIVLKLNKRIRLFWWIHETPLSYEHHSKGLKSIPNVQEQNLKILSGGEYARETFLRFRPNYQVDNLNYYIPEANNAFSKLPLLNNSKVNFICAGTIELRKGQDILVKAIRDVPSDLLRRAHFWFIGKPSDKSILREINCLRTKSYPVSYIDLVPQQVLDDFLYSCNYLISPSRLDPMPMVVAIAMAQGTPVVISDTVGIKQIVEPIKCNIIFKNTSEELKEVLIRLITQTNENKAKVFFKQNIEQFKRHFSKETFQNKLRKFLDFL